MTDLPFAVDQAGPLRYAVVATGFGDFTLVADDVALTQVHFPGVQPSPDGSWGVQIWLGEHPVLSPAAAQLAEYVAGERRSFDVPLRPTGTDFQRTAWAALLQIPYGRTRTYREQAATVGRPSAVRAVGAANGRNPLPVIVPCHRVIGSSGGLTGYAGGVDLKRRLLDLESGAGLLRLDEPLGR